MKKIYRWKFLREGFRSEKGNLKWEIGKWNRVEGELSMCENGLHCSRSVFDAFNYVQGEILAKVECRGDHIIEDNKECWREMRVVKAYEWTKKDFVAIAIYAADLILPIFEILYPNDKRPRNTIETAVNWLKNPTEENRIAARMAAKKVNRASWRVMWDVAIEKVKLDAIIELWRELIAVKLGNKTTIKKIQACFNKQVKNLKEIKNEEG